MTSKHPRESRSIVTELIMPGQTNYHGTVFGGQLFHSVDKIASIAAMRHSNGGVVTASCEALQFLCPVNIGEAIEITASVIWTHRSSMELYVTGVAENLYTGEKRDALTAYLIFVGLDDQGKSRPVPSIVPETEDEQRLFEVAEARYVERKRKIDAARSTK
ncbi:acyl-CoA thioesterase [Paenibacillus sp. N1-5-1-14]|uniref:acyl-CoA thioesterase n=1 Tax=Paenibacillus radicibacter TaxID=2972488 RepID=UPI00215958C8|nr:acyl-CoA thioesterase [Paenibacillus radicibacter]MCR8641345.1 acyl-CoA thioesterase [Paenibacillus radicibacter]